MTYILHPGEERCLSHVITNNRPIRAGSRLKNAVRLNPSARRDRLVRKGGKTGRQNPSFYYMPLVVEASKDYRYQDLIDDAWVKIACSVSNELLSFE